MCSSKKVTYETEERARKALIGVQADRSVSNTARARFYINNPRPKVSRPFSKVEQSVYKCDDCGFYHLTSRILAPNA
jgi:hypothetical protein